MSRAAEPPHASHRPARTPVAGWLPLPGSDPTLQLAFAGLFAAAVFVGRATRLEGTQLALVWPAAAVAMLWVGWSLSGGRARVLWTLGALFVVTTLTNALTSAPTGLSLWFAVANVVQAVVACLVYRRWLPGGWYLGRPRDLAALLVSAVTAAAAGALVGPALWLPDLTDAGTAETVGMWVLRNAVSMFIIVAVAIRLARAGRRLVWSPARRAEVTASLLALLAAVVALFGLTGGQPVAFLILPLCVWVALRFSTTVATVHVLASGVAVVLLTLADRGPFVSGDETADTVLAQALIAVVGFVTLLVALHRGERQYLIQQLERSRADAQDGETLLRAVVQSMTDGVLVVDPQGRALLRNPAADAMLGPGGDLGMASWLEVYRPRHGDGTPCATADLPLARALAGEHVQSVDVLIGQADGGADRLLAVSAHPLPGAARHHGAVAVFHDVTAARRAAEEVAAARDLFSAVLTAATGQSIIGTDPQGHITVFNAGAERLLGYTAEEMIGRTPEAFHRASEVVARAAELGMEPGFDVFVAHLAAGGGPETRDWTYVRKDGSSRRVALTVSALTDAAGNVTGYLGVADDVTEQRAREAAMLRALAAEREAIERLQEVDRVKNDFLASVSHELRTPITSIVGYVDMLRDGDAGPVPEQQRQLLEVVHRNSGRLMTLIEDLLTLSRVESGAFQITPAPLDLRHVVASAREALAPIFSGRALDVTFDVPTEPLVVLGDADQLERALMNLLTNAVKFTDDGGRVDVVVRRDGPDAWIAVSDTGFGISAQDQEKLFTRFFRARTATERAIQGTGLGLTIVQAIAEGHGGDVSVASVVGQGTTLSLRIPVGQPDAPALPSAEAAATAPAVVP